MICDRIRALREKTGMSARKFAEEMGMKYTTYYGYETGSREPGSDSIVALAKYYNVTTDYILGIEKSPAPAEADTGDEDAGSKVLIGYYHQLNKAGQQELVDYAEGLTYMPKYKKCDPVSEEETEVG